MFGKNNMQEMMAKLQEMQGAVSESKKRLENIYVKGETDDGNIRFVLDGNRKILYDNLYYNNFIRPEIYKMKR